MTFGTIADPIQWEGWPQARALLGKSTTHSDDSLSDVAEQLEFGNALLWVKIEAGRVILAGVTQIVMLHEGRQCFIWQLGAEPGADWLTCLPTVEEYARKEGCLSIEGGMRPGMERLLKDWKKRTVVMRKELC